VFLEPGQKKERPEVVDRSANARTVNILLTNNLVIDLMMAPWGNPSKVMGAITE
jgi:hypothetical protein